VRKTKDLHPGAVILPRSATQLNMLWAALHFLLNIWPHSEKLYKEVFTTARFLATIAF